MSGERSQRGPLHDVADLAQELRVPIKYVSQGKLDAAARTEAPQGVLARCAPLPEADLDELAAPVNGEPPFLIALDGVTDPGNFGALLRAAECCGATGVVVPRHRSVHVTPTVAKAAAGAIEHLPIAVVGGLPAALDRLAKLGVWTVGLDSGGSERIDQLGIADQPVALVLGAEGRGLSPLVRRRCEVVVAIPLRGRLGSLNVAAAGAIACYEVARRRLDARADAVIRLGRRISPDEPERCGRRTDPPHHGRGSSVGVDVDASASEGLPEIVERCQRGVGAVGVRSGESEDECFDEHDGGAMGGEQTWCPASGVEPRGHWGRQSSVERVGDEHDLRADIGRVLQKDAHVRMDATVGEHDDGVIGA